MSSDASSPVGSDALPSGAMPSGARFADAEVPESLTAGAHHDLWWIRLVLGFVALAIGVVVIVWPEATVKVLAVLFGVNLLIDGCLRLVQAILTSGAGGGARVLYALLGAISIVIGVLCLRHPLETVAVLVLLVGISWLLVGIFELVMVFSSGPPSRWTAGTVLALGSGVVALLAGVVVLAYPKVSLGTLVFLLAVSLCVSGAVSIANGFRLRHQPST